MSLTPTARRAEALAIIDKNDASMVSNHTNAMTNEIHVSTVYSMVKAGLVETFQGADGTFVRRVKARDWLQERYHVEVKGDHAYVLSAQGGFSLKVFSHGQCSTAQMAEFAEPIAEFLTALCDLDADKAES